MTDTLDAVLAHVDARADDAVRRVMDYVRQPSISAQGVGMDAAADLAVGHLRALGFDAGLVEGPGQPFVLGRRDVDPAKPTVLLYGHYDVQPPEPLEGWTTPPFEPALRDGRIWARGIGDNKGQHFAQWLAIEAHLAVTGTLPCNVVFLLEGEEEVGSPHIARFVQESADRLDVDLVVTADGALHPSGLPVIYTGVRGVASFDLVARGAGRDVHSGNFGGVVPNPIWTLVHLLATMKDAGGRITVEGLADGVPPATEAERRAMDALPLDLPALMADLGLDRLDAPEERPFWERTMSHPTLTINGLHGGYGGPGSKTVLPCEAVAKCDVRLVPPMTPEGVFAAVEGHVARHAPGVEVRRHGGMAPSRTPVDNPFAAVVADALRRARGVEPLVYPSMGGSLPDYVWTGVLGVPAFVTPYANADQRNHAPDENLEVQRFLDGIRSGAALLDRLGAMGDPKRIAP